jgi:hypothetical protein
MAVLYLSQVPEALEAAMRFPQTPWGQTVKPKESFRCVEYLRLPEQPNRLHQNMVEEEGKTGNMGTCGGGVVADVHRVGGGGFAPFAGWFRRRLVAHLVTVRHRGWPVNGDWGERL